MRLNDSSVHVFTSRERKVVPDPANRCSSPVNALSIREGIPGKIKTLRTLTWEKEKGHVRYWILSEFIFMLFFKLEDFTVTSQKSKWDCATRKTLTHLIKLLWTKAQILAGAFLLHCHFLSMINVIHKYFIYCVRGHFALLQSLVRNWCCNLSSSNFTYKQVAWRLSIAVIDYIYRENHCHFLLTYQWIAKRLSSLRVSSVVEFGRARHHGKLHSSTVLIHHPKEFLNKTGKLRVGI